MLWHPLPVCSTAKACEVEQTNADGEFVKFVSRCALHQAMSDGGMPDDALYSNIQLDSMRWAITIDKMATDYPDVFGSLEFKPDDRSLDLTIISKGVDVAAIGAAVKQAIDNHEVVQALLTKPELSGKVPSDGVIVAASLADAIGGV